MSQRHSANLGRGPCSREWRPSISQPYECTILGVEPLALSKLSDDANSDILDAAGLVEQQVRPSLSLVDKLGILAVTRIFKLNSMYLFVHMCLIYNIIIVIKLHGLKRKEGVEQSSKTSA